MKMLTCSAEEIAEKRRRAMQKLQGRTGQLIANINQNSANGIPGSSWLKSKDKEVVVTAAVPRSKTYSSPSPKMKASTNKASEFLSALGSNPLIMERLQQKKHTSAAALKDAVHPYHKSNPNSGSPYAVAKSESSMKPAQKTIDFLGSTTNCQAYLISPTRFEVDVSKFHPQLINIFKSLTTKSYDSNTRKWNFDISEYSLLQERLISIQPHVIMTPIPSTVIDLCQACRNRKFTELSPGAMTAVAERLLPFQEEGVRFAIEQGGRVMICDEMGLGKTYQALAIADYYADDWPILICTTATTRDSWQRHVNDLLSERLKENQVQLLTSNQQITDKNDVKVLISSYNMMERNLNELKQYKFGILIFDESHSLKNSKAKCTMGATRLAQNAKRIILLSGTPALSRPVELFSQLKMIDRKFMDFMEYTTRYCNGKQGNFGWDASGQSNLLELNVILKLKFMIRRTKAEVLNDLSSKKRETIILDPGLVCSNNDKLKASLDSMAKHFQESKGAAKDQVLLNYYAETAVAKVKAVCAYLEKLVRDEQKFIVFGHHRTMLNGICNCLQRLKVKFIRIDGRTKNQERGPLVERFQKEEDCRVAVLSLGACNSGITLTSTNLIVFSELTWNPSTLAQAEARAHRIGQKEDVICRYLMASNTADDCIWQMLRNKQEVLKKAGLFCENLQDTSHTGVDITSTQLNLKDYFSPIKKESKTKREKTPPQPVNFDIDKEINGLADAFNDDDDDMFKDILV